jgi:hypothetical protein
VNWVKEGHDYNPCCSGGTSQEVSCSKLVWQIVGKTQSLKTLYKKGLVEWLRFSPELKTPVRLKKKKNVGYCFLLITCFIFGSQLFVFRVEYLLFLWFFVISIAIMFVMNIYPYGIHCTCPCR